VVVDDVAVELPPRERALCAVLLDRPGTVVSKGSLLQRAWRGESVEGHAVEAAVGRLRKRLHGALTITAIARRGYRLTDS
jgi:uroporphyrinogen-III synthase